MTSPGTAGYIVRKEAADRLASMGLTLKSCVERITFLPDGRKRVTVTVTAEEPKPEVKKA